jgi:predicted CopG family antitoxin
MGKTTIEVDNETWKMLNRRKEPGQTFDDVITELLAGQRPAAGWSE